MGGFFVGIEEFKPTGVSSAIKVLSREGKETTFNLGIFSAIHPPVKTGGLLAVCIKKLLT
ncbi:MAG: hypothetical protein ACXAEU_08915 [Candidatus Hodarchaeales archaeon]|jgi:hypothetical protein